MAIPSTAKQWNAAILERGGSFLQSWEWGDFQQAFGRTVIRFHYGTFYGQAILHNLPFGFQYLYIPRGPLGTWAELEFDDWLVAFRDIAKAQQAIFLRVDPPRDAREQILLRNSFYGIGRSVQPKQNLIVDLLRSEEEILSAMHEKTRYNIHVAERHRAQVTSSKIQGTNNSQIPNSKHPEIFWELLRETEKRQGIRLHPRSYYEKMFEATTELPTTNYQLPAARLYKRLYIAFYQRKPLATALVVYFGNRATYLHGGSTIEHKNIMTPYALHWKVIQDAKAMGFEEYDMGGIDERRWPGLTRFKKGFGGAVEEFLPAHDFAFRSFAYRAYQFTRKFV